MKHSIPATQPLPQRSLGSGLTVSAMGFGAMGMSEFYGPSDDEASLALLGEVVERGVTLIDTADVYGRGHNEELIGRFLRGRPNQLANGELRIATKCGIDRPVDAAYARRINNAPAYIRSCCDASLRRLGVERIDLYYIHRVDPAADLAETMGCLGELVAEGKIAHVGLCEVSARTLASAHRHFPVAVLQSEYSLWTRELEAEILPMANALGIGLVAYSPLGRGFLTGRLTTTETLAEGDFRRSNPRFSSDNLAHNLALLSAVESVAARHGALPGQIALAWLLSRGPSIVPIPGTRRSQYLKENLAAIQLELSTQDLQQLELAMPADQVRGERYTAEGMKGVNT
jgi:aryl-alcohol dehydrogenase-like predicted oxidoreductase